MCATSECQLAVEAGSSSSFRNARCSEGGLHPPGICKLLRGAGRGSSYLFATSERAAQLTQTLPRPTCDSIRAGRR